MCSQPTPACCLSPCLRRRRRRRRITAIYQPCFVAGGAAVATGCERSQLVSLYCTATGATISRGAAGFTPGATTCGARRGDPLICSAGRAVYLLQPTWGATGAELTML